MTRASPQTRSASSGFRLWGIAEDPACPPANGSSHLAHFGSLERSYFNGKLFQCGSDEGESREVVGVPVALNYLARHRSGFQTQLGAGIFLYRRGYGGVGANGAGDLAIVDLLSRRLQVLDALPDIVDPNCQLEPERDRFRVDSVGAAGHESVFVLDRPAGDGLLEAWRSLSRISVASRSRSANAVSTMSYEVRPTWI